MNTDTYFAAFIMTYKRTAILEDTIRILYNQSHPPQKILIVDNDPAYSAKDIIAKFPDFKISYHATGYNAGPAGAAKAGLELLTKEGYQWIAWIDDDDPPLFEDTFEILLKSASKNKKCGCVGVVGQYFNRKNGVVIRVPDKELDGIGSFEVDNIAGNMSKIINADVCLKGKVYPDEKLFFGFEELDFDLRLQKSGYVLLVDKELYKKHRIYYNRIDIIHKRGKKKDINKLWREYYSTRNSMIILWKNAFYQALFFSFFRFFIKLFISFRYGLRYGILTCQMIIKAVFHFLIGKRGSIKIIIK
jgi:GT2 family glycosyltransferase